VTTLPPSLVKIECDSEEAWLHERSKLAVTASEAYQLMTKPLLHYARKKGLVDGPVQNERMTWGKRLQNEIARGFAEDTGRKVELAHPWTLFVHRDYPMVGATPDAIEHVEDKGDGCLEIKNTDIEWVDDAPAWYQAQIQVQLSCLHLGFGTLCALHRGNKLIWTDILRHDAFIKRFLSKAEEMQFRLTHDDPPAVDNDGSEETSKALAALYPQDCGDSIALPVEALDWTRELEQFKAQRKAIDEQVTLRESRLKEALGDASFGVLPDGSKWSWRAQTRIDPPRHEERISTFRVLRHLKGGK
jgi:predicted phage-related endonuclease